MMVNAYRIAIAVVGTFVVSAAAAISAGYAMFAVFPASIVLGYGALWRISRARSVYVPIGVAVAGLFSLLLPTVIYIGNEGNWNQLLGVNVFAIYVRYVARTLATLAGGAALVVACAIGFWWALQVESGRADLYMYRLHALFFCVYSVLGTIVAASRVLGR